MMMKTDGRLATVLDEICNTDLPRPEDLARWLATCPEAADVVKELVATQLELYVLTNGFEGDRSPPTDAEVEADFLRVLAAQAEADRRAAPRRDRRRDRNL